MRVAGGCRRGFFFFFSSRRRHTRFDCDWSSDVCSSDLTVSPSESRRTFNRPRYRRPFAIARSEEHTSELQSQSNLVCRLLLEKKHVFELISSKEIDHLDHPKDWPETRDRHECTILCLSL